MSDTDPATPAQPNPLLATPSTLPTPVPPATPAVTPPAGDVSALQQELDKWKAMSRKNEDEKKAALAKIAELSALQPQLTDQDKLQAQIAELTQKVDTSTSETQQLKIEAAIAKAALEAGLTKDDAEFIKGATEEEIKESAAKLAARLQHLAPKIPQSDPAQGHHGQKSHAEIANDLLANNDVKGFIAQSLIPIMQNASQQTG